MERSVSGFKNITCTFNFEDTSDRNTPYVTYIPFIQIHLIFIPRLCFTSED